MRVLKTYAFMLSQPTSLEICNAAECAKAGQTDWCKTSTYAFTSTAAPDEPAVVYIAFYLLSL